MPRDLFRIALLRAVPLLFAAVFLLGGCAGLTRAPLSVSVVGLDPLVGQGLEMRFSLKLRVQNPNDAPIDYDGIAVALDLNGTPFASGVSDRTGTVPRFGEAVLDVPVSVSAFAAARQAWNLPGAARERRVAVCAARPACRRRARHRALQRRRHAASAGDAGVGRIAWVIVVNVGQVSLKIDHLTVFNVHFDVISIFAGDAPRLAAVRGPDILPGENHGGKIRDQESH